MQPTSPLTLESILREAHFVSAQHGFWDNERNKGEMIALMHSELSECLEGVRTGAQDDHLPEFSMEVMELADTIIRIADYAEGFKLPLEQAIKFKMAYNRGRPYKHGKKF